MNSILLFKVGTER